MVAAVCLLSAETVLSGVYPFLLSEVRHSADWFGNLTRTGAVESSIPQLNSLTLELSSELSDLLGETGIDGREVVRVRREGERRINKMAGPAFSLVPSSSAHWTHIAK